MCRVLCGVWRVASAVCMLQCATFKVNIRFSNVASELLIWVSQAVGVVCLVVYVYVCVCIDD